QGLAPARAAVPLYPQRRGCERAAHQAAAGSSGTPPPAAAADNSPCPLAGSRLAAGGLALALAPTLVHPGGLGLDPAPGAPDGQRRPPGGARVAGRAGDDGRATGAGSVAALPPRRQLLPERPTAPGARFPPARARCPR